MPRYASWWNRFVAYGYDSLIVTILALVWDGVMVRSMHSVTSTPPLLSGLLSMVWPPDAPQEMRWLSEKLVALLVSPSLIAIGAIYQIGFVASPWQATPGKRLCRLRVVDTGGQRLSLGRSALRHIASGFSMLLVGLPTFTIAFKKEKTAPHDMICQTRVLRV